MSNQEHTGGLSRRTLIKSSALGSLALAAGGLSLPFSLRRAAAAVQEATHGEERIVWAPVRSTAAAAALCVHTFAMTKWSGSKPTTPAQTTMAITRCAPACADVLFVVVLTILIALTTR